MEPPEGVIHGFDGLGAMEGPVGGGTLNPCLTDGGAEGVYLVRGRRGKPKAGVKMGNAAALPLGKPMLAGETKAIQTHEKGSAEAEPVSVGGRAIADGESDGEEASGEAGDIDGPEEASIAPGRGFRPATAVPTKGAGMIIFARRDPNGETMR